MPEKRPSPRGRKPARPPSKRAPRKRRPDSAAARSETAETSRGPERAEAEPIVAWPDAAGDAGAPAAATQDQPTGPAVYSQDLAVAALGLFLAIATFFPWYSRLGLRASGWASGTWGPLVFFLGLGVAALVGLRRVGVKVSLPVEEPLVLESAGWLAAFGVALKAVRPPTLALVKMGPAWGVWLSLAAAVGLAFLAGRMSPHAPLVWIPGWYRGSAGRAGALVLVGVLAGGLAFGLANDAAPTGSAGGGPGSALEPVRGKVPDCAKNLPIVKGLRPTIGYESSSGQTAICVAQLAGDKSVRTFGAEYRKALRRADWTFTTSQQTKALVLYQLTKPKCGSVLVARDPTTKGSNVTLTLGPCTPKPGQP